MAATDRTHAYALTLEWTFGLARNVPDSVHCLYSKQRKTIFYVTANTAVMYDVDSAQQYLLQGHRDTIAAVAASRDKRWIATADAGRQAVVIVWNTRTGVPARTLHPGAIAGLAFSADGSLLATLSLHEPQELAVWDWSASDGDVPVVKAIVSLSGHLQTTVRFNEADPCQLVTCGARRVAFWTWDRGATSPTLHCIPRNFDPQRDYRQSLGFYVQSAFLTEESLAITGTSTGDMILWDIRTDKTAESAANERPMKIVKLRNKGITFLDVVDQWIVTGAQDGHIQVHSFNFRIMAWLEDLNMGPVTSLSFRAVSPHETTSDASDTFHSSDFVVGTADGKVAYVPKGALEDLGHPGRHGEAILEGHYAHASGIAMHPNKGIFAVVGHTGPLRIWNCATKCVEQTYPFERLQGELVAFDPTGHFLVVGFTSGIIKVLNTSTNEFQELQTIRTSKDCVTRIIFSVCGRFFAVADRDRCVTFFRLTSKGESEEEWLFMGKYRSHRSGVADIAFNNAPDFSGLRLISVGMDRDLVEYELHAGSGAAPILGIKLRKPLEQMAIPTACLWHTSSLFGDYVITANDQFKFKLWDGKTFQLRRTVLAPCSSGPILQMSILPQVHGSTEYLVYRTERKVVGLSALPLDGNPYRTMGMIAHPGKLTDMTCSHDGQFILTAGGADLTVNLWAVDLIPMRARESLGKTGIDPFAALIEGGKNGAVFEEMIDFFYYAQLRSQGEESTGAHQIAGTIPISAIPDLMRAVGFYPTDWEIADMKRELEADFRQQNGGTYITFEDFVKLFVNHRPVVSLTVDRIKHTFELLGADAGSALPSDRILTALMKFGEPMTEEELPRTLTSLTEKPNLPQTLTPSEFVGSVLGFDDS